MTSLVGQAAPSFTGNAIMPNGDLDMSFSLKDYIEGSYCILFFYPMDFFSVSIADMVGFYNRRNELEQKNIKVVAVSVDSYLSHKVMKKRVERICESGELFFPLVSDTGASIAKTYDALINDAISINSSFVIDNEGYIRFQMVNDLPFGRNVAELIRQVDAIDHHYETNNYCYGSWQEGQKAISHDDEYGSKFLSKNSKIL